MLKIELTENAVPSDVQIIENGIAEFTRDKIGGGEFINLTFFLRDGASEIRGGVHGNHTDFGWLYVDSLWVDEKLRNQGFGAKLLTAIESEAVKRNCRRVYLSTYSFQAPEFYQKMGYQIFGELPDFPGEHRKIFLTKKLV